MRESIAFAPELDDRALDRAADEVNRTFDSAAQLDPDVSGGGLGGGVGGNLGGGGIGEVSDGVRELVPMADYRNLLLEDILDGLAGGGGGQGGPGLPNPLRFLRNLIGGVSLGSIIPGLISGITIAPGMLISAAATITPAALVAAGATITAGSLIANRAHLKPNDVITDPVSIGQQALLEALIASPAGLTANAVLNHVFGESQPGDQGEQPRDQRQPSGNGGGLFDDLLTGLGIGGGAFAFLNRGAISRGAGSVVNRISNIGSRIGRVGRGIGMPNVTVPFAETVDDFSQRDLIPGRGEGGGPPAMFTAPLIRSMMGQSTAPFTRGRGDRSSAHVTQQNTFQIDPTGMQDLERKIEREVDQAKQEAIQELESLFSGGF